MSKMEVARLNSNQRILRRKVIRSSVKSSSHQACTIIQRLSVHKGVLSFPKYAYPYILLQTKTSANKTSLLNFNYSYGQ